MTEQEREQIEEAAVRQYALAQKREKDRDTIRAYEIKLRGRRKHYCKSAEAYSMGGRRNRAAALGECCLQAMEALDKDNAVHHFLPGTLSWIINESRVKDTDGKKGYRYSVTYHVLADEPALTDKEIQKEIDETREKLQKETEEMYAEFYEDPDEEAADPENADEAEPAGGIPEANGQAAQAPGEAPADG